MCAGKSLNRRLFLGLVPGLAFSLTLPACSDKGTGPAAVKWGKEYCDYCGMIIDDPRFAAQVRSPDGKVRKFDDLGDAILWWAKQPFAEDGKTEFWVGDSDKGTWLDGRQAFYLAGRRSPMGHNFGALEQARDGTVDFAEFRRLIVQKGSTSRCETPDQKAS